MPSVPAPPGIPHPCSRCTPAERDKGSLERLAPTHHPHSACSPGASVHTVQGVLGAKDQAAALQAGEKQSSRCSMAGGGMTLNILAAGSCLPPVSFAPLYSQTCAVFLGDTIGRLGSALGSRGISCTKEVRVVWMNASAAMPCAVSLSLGQRKYRSHGKRI